MKKTIFLLLLLPLALCCRPEDINALEPPGPEQETPDTLRILAIGNSFSADAVEQNLWELFQAAEIPVVIGNMAAPGSYLAHHWNRSQSGESTYRYFKRTEKGGLNREGWTFREGVLDEEWDFISLQQASDISGVYETYFPYLPDLKELLGTLSKAEVVFHQTWAYPEGSSQAAFATYGNDQATMYAAIMDATRRACEACDIRIVIPSGTAVQNARSGLGDTLNRDGLHLELTYGRFLAACVWFETFSGQDVRTNPWRPSSVSEEVAALCREAAHQACRKPYETTPMN